jgi:tetratricopeptide (TPR) repeat protein
VNSTVVAEGVDLAVVKFESNHNYPVARLGEYSPNQNDLTFVGGFPGRMNINSPLWQWQLNPGFIDDREQGKLQTQNNQSFSNGYDLIYSSISYGGMSGGPVFDTAGNVIGIHGRTESTDLNSLGISIQTFTGLLVKLRVNPKLVKIVSKNPVDLNSVDRNNIISVMQNIPKPQANDDGRHWLSYGNQLYRTRQLDKSVIAFDTAISKNQKLFGNYGKALSLWENRKYQLAENAMTHAIAAVPEIDSVKYYYLWRWRSAILRLSGRYDEALKEIDTAIILQRKSVEKTEINNPTLLNEKAIILSDKKYYAAAIAVYDESIRQYPQAYTYINRGNARSDLGNKKDAIADYDRAIVLNPKLAYAYLNRGVAKSDEGNKQGAIADYDRAISLNYKYANAYFNRSITKYRMGNKQDAIADMSKAAEIFKKEGEVDSYQEAMGNIEKMKK